MSGYRGKVWRSTHKAVHTQGGLWPLQESCYKRGMRGLAPALCEASILSSAANRRVPEGGVRGGGHRGYRGAHEGVREWYGGGYGGVPGGCTEGYGGEFGGKGVRGGATSCRLSGGVWAKGGGGKWEHQMCTTGG